MAVSLTNARRYRKSKIKLHYKPLGWFTRFSFSITGGKLHGNVIVRLYWTAASTHWMLIWVCRCGGSSVLSQSIAGTVKKWQTNRLLARAHHFFFPLKFPITVLPSVRFVVGCAVLCLGTTLHRSTLRTMATSSILKRYPVPYSLKIGWI